MDRQNGFRRGRGKRAFEHALDGEAAKRTDELLARLPAQEWSVVREVDSRHGIDHLIVGPGGVFAIASRKPEVAGGVSVKDGVAWLRKGAGANGAKPGVSINRDALDAARWLHRQIRTRTGRGPWVQPVVVLWCEFPQGTAETRQITFVHGRDLLAWLASRPQVLDDNGRAEVVQAVEAIRRNGNHKQHRWRAPTIGTRRDAA
jgi:hypothetical protein